MEETIEQQNAELGRMIVGQLKQKYIEVFGEETRSNNRQFLFGGSPGASRRWPKVGFPNARAAAPLSSRTMRTSGFALRTRSPSIRRPF